MKRRQLIDASGCILLVLAFILIGCLVLIGVGLYKTNSDCNKKGGAYVKTFTGYKCVKETP